MLAYFGQINIKWLFFLLVPIFICLCYVNEKYLDYAKNLFYLSFIKFFSRSLTFILWIILYKSLKNESKKENNKNENENKEKNIDYFIVKEENKKENTINSDNEKGIDDSCDIYLIKSKKSNLPEYILYEMKLKKEKEIKKKKFKANNFILLLTIILGFIGTTLKYIFSNVKYRKNISGGLTVLSSCIRLFICAIFSYFFLGVKIFERHQYFSSSIILIVAIGISLLSYFIEDKENNENFLVKLALLAVPEIIYCFMYICGYIYLIKTQGNVYKLIFFNGIFALILSIILQYIITFFNCTDGMKDLFVENFDICNGNKYKTIIENFKSFKAFGGVLTFFLIISNFCEIICIWLLIYNFSVNHFAAIFTIPSILLFIFQKNDFSYRIYYIIGCLIIILMTLIYNEIIILNFCDFNKNTRFEITKRAKRETIGPFSDEIEDLDESVDVESKKLY